MKRIVKVCAIQAGPATDNKEDNIKHLLTLVDRAALEKPDFILLPELCTTAYWCNRPFFTSHVEWAETIPGPTTDLFSEQARKLGAHIILPLYEKGAAEGEYYNSAVLIGPDGHIVPGALPDGSKVHCYRKVNPSMGIEADDANLEIHYIRGGWGYCIFETGHCRVGILICRDRLLTEAWRVLALQNAGIIFIPVASWGASRSESFVRTMRTSAQENQLFAVGCNKAGLEGKNHFFGLSCVAGPGGDVIAQGPESEEAIVPAELDLNEITDLRARSSLYRVRRPELYKLITELR